MSVLFLDAVSIIASAVAAAILVIFSARVASPEDFSDEGTKKRLIVLVLAIAVLGAVAGVAGGKSRVGVVGDIVPAALALVGTVSVYLFGADQSKGVVASICAAAFALALGLGYANGSVSRTKTERFAENLSFCRSALTNAKLLSDDGAYCRFTQTFGRKCMYLMSDDMSRITPDTFEGKSLTRERYRVMLNDEFLRTTKKRLEDVGCEPPSY